MNIESDEPLETVLEKFARHKTIGPACLFKRVDGCVVIVPTQSAWAGRSREILPVEERAQGTIDFASAKRRQLARRELAQARAAAVERERERQARA
jgi:hypothetical protein